MIRRAIFSRENHIKVRKNGNEWDFHNENTQQHLHALHPYPARFIPQIPRQAVLRWTEENDMVLDPFCGCGTTLLESILLNRPAIGIDNNAVACLISKAKTIAYKKSDLNTLREFERNLNSSLQSSFLYQTSIPEYDSLEYWFDKKAVSDLGKLKWAITQLPNKSKTLAMALLSSIIVNVSFQDSDTRYTRNIKPYNSELAIKLFKSKLRDTINRLVEIINVHKAKCEVYQGDSRYLNKIKDNTIKLIVTSPPYLNAYDYHKYHRHRLHWIDGDVAFARDLEIGKHDIFSRPKAKPDRYFDDMEECFKEWYRVLRKGGRALIVIGDAIVSGKPVSVGDEFIKSAEDIGFDCENRWIRKIEKNRKSFNQKARIDEEHVILLYRK